MGPSNQQGASIIGFCEGSFAFEPALGVEITCTQLVPITVIVSLLFAGVIISKLPGPLSHLTRSEGILGSVGICIGIVVLVLGVFRPEILPNNGAVIIAIFAALITLFTYLFNQGHRRQKIRISVVEELAIAEDQYVSMANNLDFETESGGTQCERFHVKDGGPDPQSEDCDDSFSLDHTVIPITVLESQIGEIGRLNKEEVRYLANYYALATMFQEELRATQEEFDSEVDVQTLRNRLSKCAKLANLSCKCLEITEAEPEYREADPRNDAVNETGNSSEAHGSEGGSDSMSEVNSWTDKGEE